MKLSQFKKQLKLGQIYTAYNHIDEKHLGIREVSKIQTNAVVFKRQDGKESWLFFPKAADFRSIDGNTFQVYENEKLILTYRRQI
jgi:hypothetical protein